MHPSSRRARLRSGRGARGVRVVLLGAAVLGLPPAAGARTFYVRQAAGDDANDGLSPATAWRQVARLSDAMRAGDVAYVGPGLYREEIDVRHSGTAEQPIVVVADEGGRVTGDSPGVVMLTGAEPVDESIFVPAGPPGVYRAPFPHWQVWGVVEMDGPQGRYVRATVTSEHLVDKLAPVEVVARRRATFFHDEADRTLWLHTSDDRPPGEHELELVQRGNGIVARGGKEHVTVIGFAVRHVQDAGVNFFRGSHHGTVLRVTAWGSRQGVRVYDSRDVLVYGSTLFRNENSGVYFAAGSTGGRAIGNACYENLKGLRWSSDSTHGMALDNALFDNTERGLALERADGAIVRGNRLVGNAVSQLQVLQSRYASDENCFDAGPGQLVADFAPFGFADRFERLPAYRTARHQDARSREADCGALPAKVDVHALHARAGGAAPPAATGIGALIRRWLGGRLTRTPSAR